MINTKDLMLGNWVYDGERTRFPMFIITIGGDYVSLDFEGREGDIWESTPEDLHGIPLTDKILIDAGFASNGWYCWHNDFPLAMTSDGEEWELLYDGTRRVGEPIKYVHELQNVFYNLTKKQLNVNL